jgi:predicted nucleic acid-binding protein
VTKPEVVIDTSVLVKWFHSENETEIAEARAIRDAHREERLTAYILDLSLYDASFAAAARALRVPLVCADKKLVTAGLGQTATQFVAEHADHIRKTP